LQNGKPGATVTLLPQFFPSIIAAHMPIRINAKHEHDEGETKKGSQNIAETSFLIADMIEWL
jgi:hypothetical protein